MAPEKKTYELEIAGVTFKLKTSHDPRTVQELVDYVNEKVQQALNATKSGSLQNAAVLAALNIAEEHLLLRRKANRELERLEDKASRLATDLENSRVLKQGLES